MVRQTFKAEAERDKMGVDAERVRANIFAVRNKYLRVGCGPAGTSVHRFGNDEAEAAAYQDGKQ